MQAIVQTAYGSADVLQVQTLDRPEPAVNEVRVRIYASSVTAADTMMRRGTPWYGRLFLGLLKPRFPIPGTGFSGVVESTGASVSRFRPGDSVFGESVLGAGTNCEYVCVPEEGVIAKKPESISHSEAAPVCDGAMTALNFLQTLGSVKPGDRVLVNGAAGSLGSAAVQIAKAAGADVTGVCGANNTGFVHSLGANTVIDYTATDFNLGDKQYDLVFDSVGKLGFRRCRRVLAADGLYLSPVLSLSLLGRMLMGWVSGHRRAVFSATGLLPEQERRQLLEDLVSRLALGYLKIIVDRKYALAEIATAHRYVDTGHKRANLVISMADNPETSGRSVGKPEAETGFRFDETPDRG